MKNQPGWRGFDNEKNPEVLVDPKSGEVYPIRPEKKPGDSIGNIFEYLPEK